MVGRPAAIVTDLPEPSPRASASFQRTLEVALQPTVPTPPACFFGLHSLNEATAPSIEVPLKRALRADDAMTLWVGRVQMHGPALVLADARVSSRHLELRVSLERRGEESEEAPAVRCVLTDWSTNGTFVNHKKVGRGRSWTLQSGDEVAVLSTDRVGRSEAIEFLFRCNLEVLQSFADEARGSPCSTLAATPAATPTVSPAKRQKTQNVAPRVSSGFELNLEEELTCPCCCGVYYRCVACVPCLHNFCEPCVGEWAQEHGECPVCREAIGELTRNCAMDGVVDAFLQAFPERRRDPTELQDLQARSEKLHGPRLARPATRKSSRSCAVM